MSFLIAGVLIFIGKVNADSQVASQIPPRHYRHYSKVPVDFYNASMMEWGGDNLQDRLALASPEAAKKRALQLKQLGINLVIYNGRHFRLSYQNEWPEIAREARIVTDACHAAGIRVIEHQDFTIPAYNSYPLMLEHLDWLQRDIRTGEPLRWMSPDNSAFLKFYANYLTDFQRVANPDGYMLDEIALNGTYAYGGADSRNAFKAQTGYEIPSWIGPEKQYDTAAYRAWMGWRSQIPLHARTQLMDAVHQVRPDVTLLKYGSDYSDSKTAASGMDLALDVADYCGFMGWENLNVEALNAWRPNLRALKLRQSMGDYYGIPLWALMREMTTPESTFYGWALCQLGKHSIWYGSRSVDSAADLAYLQKYNGWKNAMPQQYARTLTDTGFLLSNQTRQVNPDRTFFWNDFAGWCDLMLENNRQFDTLLDGDLLLPDRLHKYQVLILASSACLSQLQIDRLQNWVQQGGTAIVTRNSSLYDENGKRREDFGLAKAMNVHYESYDAKGRKIEGTLDGKSISYLARSGMCNINIPRLADSTVLAKSTLGQPAMVQTPYGKGRFIYVAADIGTGNYEDEFRNGRKYNTVEDAGAADAVKVLYDYAHRTAPPASLQLPAGIVGIAYQEQGGPEAGTVYIQLLNASGKSVKVGDVATAGREEKITLPPVTSPMRIMLRVNAKGDAMAQSPMLSKVLSLHPQRNADGSISLEVPGSALNAYVQIRVPAMLLPGQKPPPVPLPPQ